MPNNSSQKTPVIEFSNIEERDTDFAIIRSFLDYEKVRMLFFSQIGIKGEVIKVYHSKIQKESDGHFGESDIIFILENENERFAIFVEDKIVADPQPSQRNRYSDRGDLLKKEDGYTKFFVFLCAPKAYLDTSKADGYEYSVSHEDICELLNEKDLSAEIFRYSCDRKKQGYEPIKSESVTSFWKRLYDFIDEHYGKELQIKRSIKPRGENAAWPEFSTCVKGLNIIWKSDNKRNCIDLTFRGMASHHAAFNKIIKKVGASSYDPVKTGKSLALRVHASDREVSFKRDFDKQIDNVDFCLRIVKEFEIIAKKIWFLGITKFPVDVYPNN